MTDIPDLIKRLRYEAKHLTNPPASMPHWPAREAMREAADALEFISEEKAILERELRRYEEDHNKHLAEIERLKQEIDLMLDAEREREIGD